MAMPQPLPGSPESPESPTAPQVAPDIDVLASMIRGSGMAGVVSVLLDAAREGLSRASETGRALHASPGTGGVRAGGTATASTLAGLAVVESMARASAITGAPVIATTNDGVAYTLAENAVRRGYQRAG